MKKAGFVWSKLRAGYSKASIRPPPPHILSSFFIFQAERVKQLLAKYLEELELLVQLGYEPVYTDERSLPPSTPPYILLNHSSYAHQNLQFLYSWTSPGAGPHSLFSFVTHSLSRARRLRLGHSWRERPQAHHPRCRLEGRRAQVGQDHVVGRRANA